MGKSLTRIIQILFLFQLCLIEVVVFSSPTPVSNSGEPSSRFLDRLSEPAAQALIESMRSQFALENCMLHFDFLHTVKGIEAGKRTKGLMLIAQSNGSLHKRIFLCSDAQWVEYIIRDSLEFSVWKRDAQSPFFQVVDEALWFKPLIEGVTFRPIDLIMPYIQWQEYLYEGPQVMGVRSVVDDFIFTPEDRLTYKEHGIDSVRLSIDRQYKGIRKVEYLSETSLLSTLSVLGVKKINGLWTLSRLSLKTDGAKSIFKVNKLTSFSDFETDLYFDPSNGNIPSIAEYLVCP